MSTENDDKGTTDEPTFTRGQMAREVAKQVRAKVAEALEQYGDLDDLRKRADEGDKTKSQLDRIEEKLAESEKRTAAAERQSLVREVADELGISVRLAGKLDGKTKSELLADGRDTMEDLGIKPKGKTAPADESDTETEEIESEEKDETPATRPATGRPPRPRETLRSGAPRTRTEPVELDPMKLAAAIPRR